MGAASGTASASWLCGSGSSRHLPRHAKYRSDVDQNDVEHDGGGGGPPVLVGGDPPVLVDVDLGDVAALLGRDGTPFAQPPVVR